MKKCVEVIGTGLPHLVVLRLMSQSEANRKDRDGHRRDKCWVQVKRLLKSLHYKKNVISFQIDLGE